MSIGIFFGSTTGSTENAAEMIKEEMGDAVTHMADVMDAHPKDLLDYDVLLLGISTWDFGSLQADWDDFLPEMTGMDLSGKKIALFGCGDYVTYPGHFLDAMGVLWAGLKQLGSPELIGIWPTKGYTFDVSKALHDADHFVGLGLDEENEPDLHEERIKAWTAQLRAELGL